MHVRNPARSAPSVSQCLGLAVVASLLVVAAGCGGGSSAPPVASLGGANSTTTAGTAPHSGAPSGGSGSGGSFSSSIRIGSGGTAYSACMRSHGVPNFPDPNGQGVITFGSGNGIDPSSPQFESAQKACQKLMPKHAPPSPAQQAKMQAQALKFSACMRSHGVPKFPDPTFSGGGVQMKIDSSSGLDPSSPQFQSAQKACQVNLPGAKTGPGGGPAPSTQQAGAQ
jgi:hypothetical protein